MKKNIKQASDFKILSISLTAIIIFFTVITFRYLPLTIFNISINKLSTTFLTYYNIGIGIISTLLSAIFVLIFIKKDDNELKKRFKSIGVGIGAIIIYFFLPYFQAIPFKIAGINTNNLPNCVKVLYLIAFYLLMIAIIAFIYHKKLEQDFEDMKKNNIKYLSKYSKYWFICLFIMMASNLFINLVLQNDIAANEQAIRDTFDISPLYVFFSAVIFAPIVEELIFRLSFKKIFNNKWLFIILSGLIFGSLHVFSDYRNLYDLLYIIPYSAPGIAFAYMLEESDNILVPMSFHLFHNGILISLQFVILLFG